MFPLLQTAATILGTSFLFVSGIIMADNLLTKEDVPNTAVEVPIEADQTPVLEELLATSTPDVATTSEDIKEEVVVEETVPVSLESQAAPVVEDQITRESVEITESEAQNIDIVVAPVINELDISIEDIRQVELEPEEVEVLEREDCFDASLFESPIQCLNELRRLRR